MAPFAPGELTGQQILHVLDPKRSKDFHLALFTPPRSTPKPRNDNDPIVKDSLHWRNHLPIHAHNLPQFEGTLYEDVPFEHWRHLRDDGDWYHVGAKYYHDLLLRARRTITQSLYQVRVNEREREYRHRLQLAMAAPGVTLYEAIKRLDDLEAKAIQRHVARTYDRRHALLDRNRYQRSELSIYQLSGRCYC